PVSRDTFSVGNGVRVYVWIKAEDSENRGTRLKFYADGQEMLYSQKSLSGFPTWTIQQFSAKDLEKDIEMRLFNTRNDLIGRKSITLLE
ncbi:MAG: hypothetical protein ACLFUB_20825, partial [Cyclobacteriaceae bacterium]